MAPRFKARGQRAGFVNNNNDNDNDNNNSNSRSMDELGRTNRITFASWALPASSHPFRQTSTVFSMENLDFQ